MPHHIWGGLLVWFLLFTFLFPTPFITSIPSSTSTCITLCNHPTQQQYLLNKQKKWETHLYRLMSMEVSVSITVINTLGWQKSSSSFFPYDGSSSA